VIDQDTATVEVTFLWNAPSHHRESTPMMAFELTLVRTTSGWAVIRNPLMVRS
jgi:hypothetical protein